MEQLLSGRIWQSQINGLQGYHTAVLWYAQACQCSNQCIQKWSRCHPPPRWPPSCLHFQRSYTCAAALYVNIECELLACVSRAELFHTYVFGHTFTIESDHKPLEQINIKNLADTPVHLQRILLQLQNYDVTIRYWPGKEMLGCWCSLLLCTPQSSSDTYRHHH